MNTKITTAEKADREKKKKFTNLFDLQQYFSDEKFCREYFEKIRWNGKPVCPYCNTEKVYRLKDGKNFKCGNRKECGRTFTVTVGTVFENSKLPLSKWFLAMYLITANTKGVSSWQLSRYLGITQKSAWFVNHRIRKMLECESPNYLENLVEADESLIGGKEKNKHRNKRTKHSQGRSTLTKTPMFGILERNSEEKGNSKVHVEKVLDVKRETLQTIIGNKVRGNATVCTDEWLGYRGLDDRFKHYVVNHSQGLYVDGIAHTNSIENFWSILKRGIYGVYHSVSEKHLDRYLAEFSGRFNTRNDRDADRFDSVLANSAGRLTYKQLIAKQDAG